MKSGSVLMGSIWMILVSAFLFFLPGINGFVGGLVGGVKAGSPARGLIAAILPSVFLGALTGVVFSVFEMPVVGFLVGSILIVAIAASSLGLLFGGAVGGFLAAENVELPPARTIRQ